MSGRAETRYRAVAGALLKAPWRRPRRVDPPRTILVAHHLLLGDTLMLAALFATARCRWPQARIVATCDPAFAPLFANRPWGVEAVGFDPRRPRTLSAVHAACAGGVDLTLLPGDNRYLWLARAIGARWIRAFAGDAPNWKNLLCDELLDWPESPEALADIFARLAGGGAPVYAAGDWPAPPRPQSLELPAGRYALLHLGAGNALRRWPPGHWAELAEMLAESGLTPVLSCGPGEQALIAGADAEGRYCSYPGNLDLACLWHLVANAALVVCPDSGVAHLAKLTGRPTVCLFGQGSDVLVGAGRFFARMPFRAVIDAEVPCRDQNQLFGRQLPWVRRCARQPTECAAPFCITGLAPKRVFTACQELMEDSRNAASKL